MGCVLIEVVSEVEGVFLIVVIDCFGNFLIGFDVGELVVIGKLGVMVVDNLDVVKNDFDVLIDFIVLVVMIKNVEFCVQYGKKMVIGIMGLSVE